MICNGKTLLELAPLSPMLPTKGTSGGVTWGLSEAGYDIRIKQDILFENQDGVWVVGVMTPEGPSFDEGRFTIASCIETFHLPDCLVGIVHDKSTWARQGLSVFNTVIEPGFVGGLTLELVYHGNKSLHIPAGSGIAQVVFHRTTDHARYSGKYAGQSSNPEPARFR